MVVVILVATAEAATVAIAAGLVVVVEVVAVVGVIIARRYAWYICQHVCFPSLRLMLEYGFKSRLGLGFSDLSMWHFLKLAVRGFPRALRFPPHLHRLMVSPPPPLPPPPEQLKLMRLKLCQT